MLCKLVCRLTLFFILIFGVPAYCENHIPGPVGWVNDFANVLSAQRETELTALIQELEAKTGAEIMVATVSSIAPYDEKEYARLIFDSWKPGKIGKDNGVLLLLAVKERRWRIETGYGLEGILPDGKCGEIGRNYMVPYFKKGDYDSGIYYGVGQLINVIAKDLKVDISNIPTVNPRQNRGSQNAVFLPIFALLFFSIWNIPWPIFIGLPFTLFFAAGLNQESKLAAQLAILGYFIAIVIRYNIWLSIPADKRKSFLWILIWGLASGSGSGHSGGFGGGGFGGGGFGGGGFSGGGGGGGGGGGSGGGF